MTHGFRELSGVRIVSHHYDRFAVLSVQAAQHGQNIFGCRGIEVSGGLVSQNQVRIGDDRTCDRHPLLLAAGKLLRQVSQAIA